MLLESMFLCLQVERTEFYSCYICFLIEFMQNSREGNGSNSVGRHTKRNLAKVCKLVGLLVELFGCYEENVVVNLVKIWEMNGWAF